MVQSTRSVAWLLPCYRLTGLPDSFAFHPTLEVNPIAMHPCLYQCTDPYLGRTLLSVHILNFLGTNHSPKIFDKYHQGDLDGQQPYIRPAWGAFHPPCTAPPLSWPQSSTLASFTNSFPNSNTWAHSFSINNYKTRSVTYIINQILKAQGKRWFVAHVLIRQLYIINEEFILSLKTIYDSQKFNIKENDLAPKSRLFYLVNANSLVNVFKCRPVAQWS